MGRFGSCAASGCGQPPFRHCLGPGRSFYLMKCKVWTGFGLGDGLWEGMFSCHGLLPSFRTHCHLAQGELLQGASVLVLSILKSFCRACAFCQKLTSVQHYLQRYPVCPRMPLIQPLGIRLFPVQRQPLAFLCPQLAIEVLF